MDRQQVTDWLAAAPGYDPRLLARAHEHYQRALAEDKDKGFLDRTMTYSVPPSISTMPLTDAATVLARIRWNVPSSTTCPIDLARNHGSTRLLEFTSPPLRRLRGYTDVLALGEANIGRGASSQLNFVGSVYRDPDGDVVVLWRYSTFEFWRELG